MIAAVMLVLVMITIIAMLAAAALLGVMDAIAEREARELDEAIRAAEERGRELLESERRSRWGTWDT